MAFNQNSFIDFTNNDIVESINNINQGLNENLEIADTRRYRGGAKLRNIRTLYTYLNQHNAQEIINPDFKDDNEFEEGLDNFIIHEQERHKQLLNESYERNYENISKRESFYDDEQPNESDIHYFNEQQSQINQEYQNKRNEQNYNNNIANRESFYDEQPNESDVEYFEQEQNKIKRHYEIEDAIKRANEAVDNAIQLINEFEKSNLKKIEPKLIKDKSHLLEYYIPENEELYEYLDKFNNKFKSKHNDYLMINEPHDFDKAVEVWDYYTKYDKDYVDKEEYNGSPIVIYYFNQISSLNQIFESLQQVFDRELKPFKIHFQLSGVFETPVHDLENEEKDHFEYEARNINWKNYQSTIPIIISSLQDLDYVKMYIESNLNSYETSTSSTKLTIVGSVSFTVSRMRKVTGHIKDLPEEFIKNDFIISDNEDDKLCFYRFLAICLSDIIIVNNVEIHKLANTQKYDCAKRTKVAKKILLKEHNIEYNTKIPKQGLKILKEFKGVTMEQMEELAKKHHLNINIYEFTKTDNSSYYDLSEQWFFDKSYPTHSALLFSKDQIIHIMYIKNPEKLTQIHICPKCHSYTHRGNSQINRFESHVKHCDGVFKKNFIPNKEPLPFCPHILNNPVYEYCLAYDLEWKPNIYYMTYDFETMEQSVNKSISDSTVINSRLIPLSVASCVKLSSGLITKHFSLRESEEFIPEWISWLFEQSMEVLNDKIVYDKSFLPADKIYDIDTNIYTITVFGFNSSRFDSNLFKKYLNHSHWHVESNSLIGTISSLKQFILVSDHLPTKLRFIDAQSFVAGGTLKQFGIDFGGETNSVKGVFPYEAVNSSNYNEVLSKSEPFSYNDFDSYLNQKNPLSKSDYQIYLEDAKNYKTRWDYLLAYNDNDVEMMIKPIDNLIQLNAQYKVDLISNLSLSKNASCIKYALAYKDFNPHENYNPIHKYNEFMPNPKWWQFKCENYYKQDERYNLSHPVKRDLSKCVSSNDYKEFLKLYNDPIKGKCHLCKEHFTYQNKPTLDRINNDIGHEFSNCLLACAECNKLRKRDDPKITALRI